MDEFRIAIAQCVGALSILPFAPKTDVEIRDMTLAYLGVVEDIQLEANDVRSAMRRLLRVSDRFPTPREFRCACRWAVDQNYCKVAPVLVDRALPVRGVKLCDRADRDQILEIRERAYQKLGFTQI